MTSAAQAGADRCRDCGAAHIHARDLCGRCYTTWRRGRLRALRSPKVRLATRVTADAERRYRRWGLRCLTLAEFGAWHGAAVACPQEPVTFLAFCHDALPGWCAEQVVAGRCVRAKQR